MFCWIELQRGIPGAAGVAVTVLILVGIFALPSSAQNPTVKPSYQVNDSPNSIRPDAPVTITVRVANGVANCVYLVSITVTDPNNVSHSKTVSFKASSAGNGATSTPYPDTFTAAPNTHTVGTYHVAAMFKCGAQPYTTPAATDTFKVHK